MAAARPITAALLLTTACLVNALGSCDAKMADCVAKKRCAQWHQHRSTTQSEKVRRSLLQQDTAAAPAAAPAAGPPLQLPKNALKTCTLDKQKDATRCKAVKQVYYEQKDAGEECCQLLSSYFSDASTRDTRNCFCDPDVWARELALEEKNHVLFGAIADACTTANFTVGRAAVHYYQDGKGPCAGLPAKSEDEEEQKGEMPKQRTFFKWVRKGFPENPWVLFCFIVSIFSVMGFLLILWPFVFHSFWTLVEPPDKMRAKKTL